MLVINGRNEAVEIRWLVQIVEADDIKMKAEFDMHGGR